MSMDLTHSQPAQNTQPAIMTVGVSIFNVLKNEFGIDLNKSKFFAGHSLGEYSALVCSGSLSIDRAAFLLNERGKSMQDAVPIGEGAMMAILGMSIEEISKETQIEERVLKKLFWRYDKKRTMYDMVNENE